MRPELRYSATVEYEHKSVKGAKSNDAILYKQRNRKRNGQHTT
jgi:hypothetical protein